MSRVWLRGKTWWVDYRDERGQRVRESLKGVRSKRDAEGELAELVAQARRRRLGLEPTAAKTRLTVWDLVEWWLSSRCPPASAAGERQRLEKHVKPAPIARVPALQVEASHFEALFSELARPGDERRPLSAASVNHVRAKLRTVFERARREGLFSAPNPLLDTRKLKVKRRAYETLRLEEVPRVLAMVAPQWRSFVATSVFMALRKGELGGMHKRDVDLPARVLRVGRSWERQTTKGGETVELPIPDPLVPYLEAALKTPGPFLFPNPRGGMVPRESDPHLRLRTALKRAGIVDGYRVWCNRCPPEAAKVVLEEPGRSRCVVHRRQMWVSPIPRAVRLHDMRHTTATILLRAGVPLHHVQRILRHADPQTTSSTYAHLVTPDLRDAMRPLGVGTNTAHPTTSPQDPTEKTAMTTERSRRDSNARPLASEAERVAGSMRSPLYARAANGPVFEPFSEGQISPASVPFAAPLIDLAQRRHNPAPRAFRGGMKFDDDEGDSPTPASSPAGVRRG